MRQVGWAEATSGSLMLFLGRHPGPSPAQANRPALQPWSPPILGPGQPRAVDPLHHRQAWHCAAKCITRYHGTSMPCRFSLSTFSCDRHLPGRAC